MDNHDNEFVERIVEQIKSGDSEQVAKLIQSVISNLEQAATPLLDSAKDRLSTFLMIGSILQSALDEAKASGDMKPTVLSTLKLLKDEDTLRGLNFVLKVVKAIGKQI